MVIRTISLISVIDLETDLDLYKVITAIKCDMGSNEMADPQFFLKTQACLRAGGQCEEGGGVWRELHCASPTKITCVFGTV